MKTTQKAIRTEIEAGRAIDLTTAPSNEVLALRKAEHGFRTVATNTDTYGLTGCVPFQYHKPPKSNANTTRQTVCSVLY